MANLLRTIGLVLLCFGIIVRSGSARDVKSAQHDMDAILVLAVDASYSITADEWALQMQGYAEALQDAQVIRTLTNGVQGRVAITMVQWSSHNEQAQAVPWSVVYDTRSAHVLALQIAESGRLFQSRTSISGAIAFSTMLIDAAPYRSAKKIIDISGDGPNNSGPAAQIARDHAVSRGATINALVMGSLLGLDTYYEHAVIGGPGSFMIRIADVSEFASAIKRKLILEVAGIDVSRQEVR